jgi:serine protease Do
MKLLPALIPVIGVYIFVDSSCQAGRAAEIQVGQIARSTTVFIQSLTRPNDIFGSGVLVGKSGNTYTVITAKHVVALADSYRLTTSDGSQYAVKSLQQLPNIDLAILQFDSKQTYQVVRAGNQARELESLYIAGYPKPTTSVTYPEYSIVEAKVNTILDGKRALEGYSLRYGAILRRGMNGGPVLNQRGELIAIHGRADEMGGLGIPVNTLLENAKVAGIRTGLVMSNTPPSVGGSPPLTRPQPAQPTGLPALPMP